MADRVHPFCTRECQHGQPGPHPVPKPLPSRDPRDYPVMAGPYASGPQEANVVPSYRPDGPRPAPYDPMALARRYAEPEVIVYPAPAVTSKDGLPGPAKAAVGDMETHAVLHGWNIRTTYAKGHVPHARLGTPSATPRESLAVRMWRGEQRAVAVYVGAGKSWSWTTLYLWRLSEFPTKYINVTSFRDALTVEGSPWR